VESSSSLINLKMVEDSVEFFNRLQRSKNRLLVKDQVGKAKQQVFKLPPPGFTYGKALSRDKEGVGAVMGTWVTN
jgi:hypothetical protein